MALPILFVARHGETEWSRAGRHTGISDLPLTEAGEQEARRLGERLRGRRITRVFASPLLRARRTCDLAGFADPDILADAAEWNYGRYEGLRTAEIQQQRPGWNLFCDGCPDGESAADVGARADRVIAAMRAVDGDTLLFSSSHFLRVMAARWLGLAPEGGRHFLLGTGALGILGYEHDSPTEPVIRLWNDTGSLPP